jgi:hypothetical protein
MMESVELLVNLKIPDVTALTAANTLRRRMGFADTLKVLGRTDYYRLSLQAADGLALAAELAEQTNLFVNPNKHAFVVRPAREQPLGPHAEQGLWLVEALVTDAAGPAAPGLVSALRDRLGYGAAVSEVERGVLWTLYLACSGADEARDLAAAIVVTRSRERGLLMNPHFQTWNIL